MKFFVLSDIHLEMYDKYPGIDHFINIEQVDKQMSICLCGDIGDPFSDEYKTFLNDCSFLFLYVFIIAGNHEYYNSSLIEVVKQIKLVCNSNANIVFLNNSSFDIPNTNIRILGTTLWTSYISSQIYDIRYSIADYKYIKDWSVSKNLELHRQSMNFIKSQMNKEKSIIVMSHHAPLLACGNPKYENSRISSAFKNDLETFIIENTKTIKAWMYGHDHYSMNFKLYDTIIISNQIGYPDEIEENECCLVNIS